MTHPLIRSSLVAVLGSAATLLCALPALAHGDISCHEPKAEWKKQTELQRKLEGEGWKVRQVKTDNGCYEVYGFDEKKRRVEVYFNPRTFEKVGEVKQGE